MLLLALLFSIPAVVATRGPLSSLYAPRHSFSGARNNLLALPPMGFMTWELFRCGAQNGAGDDGSDPLTTYQISSALLRGQAQAMSQRGFAAAGYTLLSIDDVRVS